VTGSRVSALGGVPSESDHPDTRVSGFEFRVSDFGFRIWVSEFRASALGGVPSESDHPGFRFQDAGCIVSYFGERFLCFCTGWSTK